jgi:hypothetical protein
VISPSVLGLSIMECVALMEPFLTPVHALSEPLSEPSLGVLCQSLACLVVHKLIPMMLVVRPHFG